MKKAFLWAGFAVLSAGCGTVCNLAHGVKHPEDGPKVYGGVQRDLEFFDRAASGQVDLGGFAGDAWSAALLFALVAAEPVLSFAADTATLPITVRAQKRRAAAEMARTHAWPPAALGPPRAADGTTGPADPQPAGPGLSGWRRPENEKAR